MTFRDKIAAMISPNMDMEAQRYRKLREQIKTEIWWLSEFQDARETLQRLIDADRNYWRSSSDPYQGDIPSDISKFREMLRQRSASPEIVRLKADLDRVTEANLHQASCIHQCAAAIGPDTSWTLEGLPLAVKRVVKQLKEARECVGSDDLIEAIMTEVSDTMCDAEVSFPAGREEGANIDYDEADLRRNIEPIVVKHLSNARSALVAKIAEVSSAVGFQSGEPAIELAGQIISVLAGAPEHIDRFMKEGSELFIDSTFAPEKGTLTYRSIGGDILHPSVLRKAKGLEQ